MGPERVYKALRLATALETAQPGKGMTVFLLADVVAAATVGQNVPHSGPSAEQMLKRVLSAGGKALLCGTCMDARGLQEDRLIEGARHSTMQELAAATLAAERVLVF